MHSTEIAIPTSQDVAIVFVSDLHADSPLFQANKLKRQINTISEQYQHVVCCAIGDVMDAIYPNDHKRFTPSSQHQSVALEDDYVMARIRYATDVLRDVFGERLRFISRGNHEDTTIKHSGVNPTKEIAQALGIKYGPYAGVIRFIFSTPRIARASRTACFHVAYHHGAWGGKYAKGYLGALPWFSSIEGVHACVYGHNHMSRQDVVKKWGYRTPGRGWEQISVPIINCASWVDDYSQTISPDSLTHYSIRHGYPPQPNTIVVFIPKFILRSGYWEIEYPYQVYHC